MRNFVKVLLAFMLVAVAGYGVYTSQTKTELSDIMLENVEALADNESDCHYTNGYKAIQLEESFWHDVKKRYYDCCGLQVDGYNDDGPCS